MWISVHEDLPAEGQKVLTYTSVIGTYELATFCAATGWRTLEGKPLKIITHWSDQDIDLPFDVRDKVDTALMKRYGLDMQDNAPTFVPSFLKRLIQAREDIIAEEDSDA